MTQQFDNTNRGALFTNDKQGNERRPDMTGNLDVGGKKFRISAWRREGSRGPFLSLSVEEPRALSPGRSAPASARQAAPAQRVTEAEPFNDDIPF